MWMMTLKMGAQSFDTLFVQTCAFIAGQDTGVYQIKNDRMRLAVTYLHFKTLGQLAETPDRGMTFYP
jgi:hypothetical protein